MCWVHVGADQQYYPNHDKMSLQCHDYYNRPPGTINNNGNDNADVHVALSNVDGLIQSLGSC